MNNHHALRSDQKKHRFYKNTYDKHFKRSIHEPYKEFLEVSGSFCNRSQYLVLRRLYAFRSESCTAWAGTALFVGRTPFSGDAIIHTGRAAVTGVSSAISCKNTTLYKWVSLLTCIFFLVILPTLSLLTLVLNLNSSKSNWFLLTFTSLDELWGLTAYKLRIIWARSYWTREQNCPLSPQSSNFQGKSAL